MHKLVKSCKAISSKKVQCLNWNNNNFQKSFLSTDRLHNCINMNGSRLVKDIKYKSYYRCMHHYSSCRFNKNNSIYKIISLFSQEANYDVVLPWEVTPSRLVPDYINCPEYARTGFVNDKPEEIEIKDEIQIGLLKNACQLARKILNCIKENIQVGMTTDAIDQLVHQMCIQNKSYPSPLNYMGFPKSVCTSVNNVACHGIPDNRPLKDGDIISVDVSVFFNGYHGDCAATFGVGNVDPKGQKLIEVSKTCLQQAINICCPKQQFSKIGETVSKIALSAGYSVVPAFCGHGIGTYFHGPPQILHYSNSEKGIMKSGMTFTIEPVICEGKPDIVILEDGWTAVTLDNSRCAQFEHTVLITEEGVEVLTVL